jgi:hypothetical protein
MNAISSCYDGYRSVQKSGSMSVRAFYDAARVIADKTYDDYRAARTSGLLSASKLTKLAKRSDKAYRDLEIVEQLFLATYSGV